MSIIDKLEDLFGGFGRSNGHLPGARPGDGAVLHESSGNADFDGLPGDELPPRKSDVKDEVHSQRQAAD